MPTAAFTLPAGVDNLESCTAIKQWVLNRADEQVDGSSDFDRSVDLALVQKFRDLRIRHPWLCTIKYPPGLILLQAPVTGLTATVFAGSFALTLSAAPPNGLLIEDWIIIPAGADYFLRVTAHVSGSTSVTVDGAPETLTDHPVTIAKIEYDLPDGCGVIVDSCFWTHDEEPIELVTEEVLRHEHPGVPEACWPPERAARITKTKVRFSSYPPAGKRVIVNYTEELDDPCATEVVPLDGHLRSTLAEGTLSILYEMKGDERQKLAEARYQEGIRTGKDYEHLLKVGTGSGSNQRRAGAYYDG